VLEGRARIRSERRVEVDGTAIGAGRLIVATGTKPVVPPIEGLADGPFLPSETVWDLTRVPASLLVLGGGPIGCARLLGKEEPAASEVIAQVFKRDGIELRLGAKAVRVRYPAPDTVRVELDDGSILDAQHLLVAVGPTPVTEGLGLESAGVGRDERGFIRTDERMATSARGVFAAGDVTGRLLFTHAADEMGRIAAGNALRWPMRRRFRAEWTPWVTFTRDIGEDTTVPELTASADGLHWHPAGADAATSPHMHLAGPGTSLREGKRLARERFFTARLADGTLPQPYRCAI